MSNLPDVAIQVAETLQTAHINQRPSIEHDLAPSTAAERKDPVQLDIDPSLEVQSDVDEDEVPLSVLQPIPRRPQMPPLPDLRFEQSYLASIKNAQSWQMIAYITIRDQVMMPLVQGMAWTLLVAGWRHWNGSAKFRGQTIGARIRRWWWGVNDWPLPASGGKVRDENLADGVRDFYTTQSNTGLD